MLETIEVLPDRAPERRGIGDVTLSGYYSNLSEAYAALKNTAATVLAREAGLPEGVFQCLR